MLDSLLPQQRDTHQPPKPRVATNIEIGGLLYTAPSGFTYKAAPEKPEPPVPAPERRQVAPAPLVYNAPSQYPPLRYRPVAPRPVDCSDDERDQPTIKKSRVEAPTRRPEVNKAPTLSLIHI
eukprot:TRINITY_DN62152_c0_g1_i1.p2 TRINITY_DN62152_c0_g1~~TRINITY_DN62152_c0_g1_i1.p2  ORF type:complete len:122 (-),score=17.23 TRINITY_DN62152_c0_g1_i1:125-490(-)